MTGTASTSKIQMPRPQNKGKFTALLVAVVLSSIIWLAFNLSQQYVDVVSVQVCAKSDIEGRAVNSSSTAQIVARVRASGFYFVYDALGGTDRIKNVEFSSSDLKNVPETDQYEISEAALRRYFNAIFGNDASLEAFQSKAVQFRFLPENHRKVPIKGVLMIDYRPQYCGVGGVRFDKDSVTVYGEPSRIESIDAVYTEQIVRNDVRSSLHGTVGLEAPGGVRLAFNETGYSLEVVRYVEISDNVEIKARNVPRDVSLSIYPSSAEATFRCAFPYDGKSIGKISFYVDYHDFQNSITGRCAIRSSELPDGVLNCRIDPQVCECLVTVNSPGL